MSDVVFTVLSEHGPWVVLVFYLLYRDLEKDRATRQLLDKNTAILVELSTIIRERLPGGGAAA
ncbi:MAG: hypothetical protein AAFR34_04880 [Pseudomonadota bacterium]